MLCSQRRRRRSFLRYIFFSISLLSLSLLSFNDRLVFFDLRLPLSARGCFAGQGGMAISRGAAHVRDEMKSSTAPAKGETALREGDKELSFGLFLFSCALLRVPALGGAASEEPRRINGWAFLGTRNENMRIWIRVCDLLVINPHDGECDT